MLALKCKESELRGALRKNESMAAYTSFQAGGRAEFFYRPKDLDDVCFFLSQLSEEVPVVWLGLGSNTLVQDGGIKGVVICTRNALNKILQHESGNICAQAGVTCAKLSKFSINQGLSGGEFFAGIPGVVGGALAMNAGAFGGATWESVEEVELVDRQGRLFCGRKEEFSIGYRAVAIPMNRWFVSATFRFGGDDEGDKRQRVRALLDKRNSSQPIGVPSFGSVFKNPENDYAGRLIELCGLKGEKIGGAYVSKKHANFILNDGTATATDALALIRHIIVQVEKQQAVTLEPEVRLLGEAP